MNDNERESVKELIFLARMAIVAMLLVGGYVNRSSLIGMI